VWPTEPAKADWSFNKWLKTRILKKRRRHRPAKGQHLRQQSGRAWAVARAAVAALAVAAVVVAPAADAADQAVALAAVVVRLADKAAADATAGPVARVADVDAMESRVIVTVAEATAEVSSSRTSSPSTALPRS
jgi:hypothetical protein